MNRQSLSKYQKMQAPRQQKGAGMMEVLIALLVLSIGILGLATLQSIGLKYNHQSYQRTQAILQIYDMADRIRSNGPGKVAAYDGFALAGKPASLTKDCAVFGTACTFNERATYDFESWRQSLDDNLGPTAQGSVIRQLGTPIHVITVNWNENDVPKSFIYEAQL